MLTITTIVQLVQKDIKQLLNTARLLKLTAILPEGFLVRDTTPFLNAGKILKGPPFQKIALKVLVTQVIHHPNRILQKIRR